MRRRIFSNTLSFLILFLGFFTSSRSVFGETSRPSDYFLNASSWDQKDGLPDWRIFSFMQDHQGLIWLSSLSGLHTFDGYKFREAIPGLEFNGDGYVQTILEGHDHNIWVFKKTSKGMEIDVFNPRDESLLPLYKYYNLERTERIIFPKGDFFAHAIDGKIWLFLDGEMYQFGESLTLVKSASIQRPFDLFPATSGFWEVSTESNAVSLRDNNAGLQDIFEVPAGFKLLKFFGNRELNLILLVSNQQQENVFLELRPGNGRIISKVLNTLPDQEWINSTVYNYTSGRTLLQGVSLESDGKSVFLKDIRGNYSFNLSEDYPEFINSFPFFFDKDGGIWCSNPRGLFRWKVNHSPYFTKYLTDEKDVVRSTRGMLVKDGKLFVTSYAGARIVDLQTGTHQPFGFPDNKAGFSIAQVGEDLYIGKAGMDPSLAKYGPQGTTESFRFKSNFFEIFDILPLKDVLWLGTNEGLVAFDLNTKKFTPLAVPNLQVYHIHENKIGFWLLTNDKLVLVDKTGKVLHRFLPKTDNLHYRRLTHLYEDLSGDFWISTTGGGLIHFDPLTGKIKKVLDMKDGLVHNNIHSVYPDNHNNLWLSSDNGLMRLNKETFVVKSFFEEDGISNNEFNFLSHYQNSDGEIFLGSVDGVTVFNPDDIPQEITENLTTLIIDVRSFNISDNIYQSQVKNGAQKNLIFLRPEDSFLELGLSAMEFTSSESIKYIWKINTLQSDWVIQDDPVIRLSKLDYGDHILEYSAFKSRNLPGQNIQSLRIRVPKPFYLRFPFMLAMIFLGGGLAYAISLWRTKYLTRENQKLEKLVELRTLQIAQDKEIILEQAEGLRRMDEIKSRFFSNITHEFRTPLSLMIGPVELMLKGNVGSGKSKEYLTLVQRNAYKLLNLIEELLDFTKSDEKKQLPEYSYIPFLAFLSRKITIFNSLAIVKKIRLELDYRADENLVLKSDVGKWRKIISNLLDNAIKYTPNRGKVTLVFEQNSEGFLVSVEDTGIGIPAEELPYIFDRFFRSKHTPPNIGGTGIGLALCKEYCEILGASIKAKSTPGNGTTVQIAFRAETLVGNKVPGSIPSELLADLPQAETEVMVPANHIGLANLVLIVEDDPDMLSFLRMILQPEYEILTATNGDEAMKIMAGNKVDIVVSDLMMPVMDGMELLKKVKAAYGMVPFILLTARVGSEDKIKALGLGVDDYLAKPFNPDELLVRVENLIDRYKIRLAMRTERNEPESEDESYEQQWIRQLEAIVRENLSNPDFTVLMLADSMNVSERNLQYKTKSMLGLNPKQFILEIRLNEALRLLDTGTYPTVAEVCFAVGFKSTQYFSKVMKKRFGKSPSEYL